MGHWDTHIPGPKHYKKLQELLGNTSVAQVKNRFWQVWTFPTRKIRFNHLDGQLQTTEVATIRVASTAPTPSRGCIQPGLGTAPPPPPGPPPPPLPPPETPTGMSSLPPSGTPQAGRAAQEEQSAQFSPAGLSESRPPDEEDLPPSNLANRQRKQNLTTDDMAKDDPNNMEIWVNTHSPDKKSSQHFIPQGTTYHNLLRAVLKGKQDPDDYKVDHRGRVADLTQRIWPNALCLKGRVIDITPKR